MEKRTPKYGTYALYAAIADVVLGFLGFFGALVPLLGCFLAPLGCLSLPAFIAAVVLAIIALTSKEVPEEEKNRGKYALFILGAVLLLSIILGVMAAVFGIGASILSSISEPSGWN